MSSLISSKIIKAFFWSQFTPLVLTDCVLLGYYHFTAVFYILDYQLFVIWEKASFYIPSNFVGLIKITYFSRGKLGILQFPLSRLMCTAARTPSEALTVADLVMDTGHSLTLQPSAFIWLHFSCLLPQWLQGKPWTWYIKHCMN